MISIKIKKNIDELAVMFWHSDFDAIYFGYIATTKLLAYMKREVF